MAKEVTPHLLSYDDYVALPDDGRRYEVDEGRLVMVPSPNLRHQGLQVRLVHAIYDYLLTHPLGEVYAAPLDVVFQAERPGVIQQPDVLYVSYAHRERMTEANIQGPPDLAVEIVSKWSVSRDLVKKRRRYGAFGVPEYWIVLPEDRSLMVHTLVPGATAYDEARLLEDGDVLETPQLPGFSLRVEDLFGPLSAEPDDEA